MSTKYAGMLILFEKEISEERLDIVKEVIWTLGNLSYVNFLKIKAIKEIESNYEYNTAYEKAKWDLAQKVYHSLIKGQ
jgi:hypothetical protein